MKKENFICPCCGLPNHLEFKSEADYNSYLEGQHSSDKFEANPNNYQFNRYILEENEEESDRRKKEIEDRFNLIKDYWNKYQNFEEWFGKEVVGFIPDIEPPIPPEKDYIIHSYNDFKQYNKYTDLETLFKKYNQHYDIVSILSQSQLHIEYEYIITTNPDTHFVTFEVIIHYYYNGEEIKTQIFVGGDN